MRRDDNLTVQLRYRVFAPVARSRFFDHTPTELTAVGFKMPEGNENKDSSRGQIYQAMLLVVAALLMAIALSAHWLVSKDLHL